MTSLWRVGDALWAIFAGYATATLALIALDTLDPTAFETFGIVLPIQQVTTFAAFYWLTKRRGSQSPLSDLGLPPARRDGWMIGAGVLLAIVATVFVTLLSDTDEAPQEIARIAAEATGLTAFLAFVGTVVGAPVVEEIVFRGVLLRGLERHVPVAVAAALSAGAFAAFHYGGPDTLVILGPLFVLGVILAATARRRGLGAAILLHSGFNLLAAVSLFV